MSPPLPKSPPTEQQRRPHPFRRAVLRGLGIVLPPLLTIVLFIWAWTTIDGYVLRPMETVVSRVIVFVSMRSSVLDGIPGDVRAQDLIVIDESNDRVPSVELTAKISNLQAIQQRAPRFGWRVVALTHDGVEFVPIAGDKWIPRHVHETVRAKPRSLVIDTATPDQIFDRYVHIRYLPRWRVIPVFLVLFIAILYLLGKFLAAGVGRMFWTSFEAIIHRLPIVRNVYSSVKQVTDFIFSEREIEYTRVVAVEYPRKGMWSVGFVTGESMMDIRSAANEPVLSVLMPTSPMPATGFTITVRKSEVVDLDITIDQAIQFVVSCGVVVPANQLQDGISAKMSSAIAQQLQTGISPRESVDSPDTN
jgi:uncharacterized membrane protein